MEMRWIRNVGLERGLYRVWRKSDFLFAFLGESEYHSNPMEPIIKIRGLMDNGAVLEQIAPTEVTPEDVFIAKTGRALTEDTLVN